MPEPAALRAAVAAERDRAVRLFDRLAADGADAPGISRDPYGPGEQRAHATIAAEAAALGLDPGTDAAANLYASWAGRDRSAPRIVIGSHLDSVPHGGNFDGAAGVVAGLVAVAALRRLGIVPARDVTVMGIRAEESVWFQVSYIGSRGALGTLPDGALAARRVDTGRPLAEHLAECGGDPAALAAGARALDPAGIAAYVELHIEQAPSLIEAGRAVGIATGIPGNVRFPHIRISGRNDHVGLPRRFRRDAALAGAALALGVEQIWRDHEARGIPMAATIGRFHTDLAQHGLTIVPGAFELSLDLRAYTPEAVAGLEAAFRDLVATVAAERGVRIDLGPRASAAVGPVDSGVRAGLERAAAALGVPVLALGSPASHDAAAFAAAGVKMGMIFVRNANGSHNPEEAMTIEDFLDATAVLTAWLAEAVAG